MRKSSAPFLFGETIPWENAGEGVKRQILGYDENLMLVKVSFEKNSFGSPHSHIHSQSTYVESGLFEFIIGEEKQIVKQGDGLYIPPEIVHSCICLENGVLIDAFSPFREDFICNNNK
jgi:quercetin dioxygenase-like cupin family protein